MDVTNDTLSETKYGLFPWAGMSFQKPKTEDLNVESDSMRMSAENVEAKGKNLKNRLI